MYPKHLVLSEITDHGAKGKSIKYYCPATKQIVQRKCYADHEADQRTVDTNLLRHICNDYYEAAMRSQFINAGKYTFEAMETLRVTRTALDGRAPSDQAYKFCKPYSQELLNQAAARIKFALEYAGYSKLYQPVPGVKALHDLLTDLATQVENRYFIEIYEY